MELGEGLDGGINDSTGAAEKKSVKFIKPKAKFCLSLRYNGDESYLYVNKAENCKFNAKDNISWYNFCLESISNDIQKMIRVKLFEIVLHLIFQLIIVQLKKDILNIHQHLVIKNNLK